MTYRVYALGDPRTDKVRYVGCTTLPLKQRVQSHVNDSRRTRLKDRPCLIWLKELDALGLKPRWKTLEVVVGDEWESRERYWIERCRSQGADLTNITSGGLGLSGMQHSESTRLLMSESRLANPVAIAASRANIKKAQAARKGKPLSEAHREAIRQAMTGRVYSEETREKLRLAHLGRKRSPEQVARMRGRRMSEETKAKMRLAWEGRRTATHCQKGHEYGPRDFRPDGRHRCRRCEAEAFLARLEREEV